MNLEFIFLLLKEGEILASKIDIEQGLIIEQSDPDIQFNKWLSKR